MMAPYCWSRVNPNEDTSAEFPREIYYIDRKSAENREIVEFELASVFDLAGVQGTQAAVHRQHLPVGVPLQ
jgi:lambda family phage minor tail protein L